jgi:hypothetical protein
MDSAKIKLVPHAWQLSAAPPANNMSPEIAAYRSSMCNVRKENRAYIQSGSTELSYVITAFAECVMYFVIVLRYTHTRSLLSFPFSLNPLQQEWPARRSGQAIQGNFLV